MNFPYCNIKIELIKVNCGVLRCGIYKLKNGKIRQLPKHASKKKIERLKPQIVYGCGNPLKYSRPNNELMKCLWELQSVHTQ
jgi:hypothetical protein